MGFYIANPLPTRYNILRCPMNNKEKNFYLNHIKISSKSRDFKLALTHYNYYGSDKNKGFSQYLYIGNYIFRGLLADRLLKKENKAITELEKALTKIFSQKELSKLFDYYELEKYARYGEDFSLDSLKKDFAIAFLGFITHHSEKEFLDEFIYKNFIRDKEYLYPQEKESLEDFVHKYYKTQDKNFQIETTKNDESYTSTIKIDGQIFLSETSTGYKYSRKKAYKSIKRIIEEN